MGDIVRLGSGIKRAVKEKGKTLKSLAEYLQMTYANLNDILSGRTRMTLETATRIAEYLDLNLDQLNKIQESKTTVFFDADGPALGIDRNIRRGLDFRPKGLEQIILEIIIDAPTPFFQQLAKRISEYLPESSSESNK